MCAVDGHAVAVIYNSKFILDPLTIAHVKKYCSPLQSSSRAAVIGFRAACGRII